jgi:hypothetical protein
LTVTRRLIPGAACTLPVLIALSAGRAQEPRPARDRTPGADSTANQGGPSRGGRELALELISGSESLPLDGLRLGLEPAADGSSPRLRLGERLLPLEEVILLGFPQLPPRGEEPEVDLCLHGGDRLSGTIRGGGDDLVELAAAAVSAVEPPGATASALAIDLTHVAVILVRRAFADEVSASRFRRSLTGERRATDTLHLASGERLSGILDGVDQGGVRFSSERLGRRELAFSRVRALALASLEGEKPARPGGVSIAVHLQNGSLLSGELESLSNERLILGHRQLGKLRIEVEAVAQLAVLGGRCQYLSDLEPARTHEHLGPLFRAKMPFQRDASVTGAPLRMGGKAFTKGLGVHAYSLLEYDLAGGFKRFQATIGLDESARPQGGEDGSGAAGAVVFRVHLDGKVLLELPLTHRDPPRAIDLPVAGGKRLGLEVDFGETDFHLALDRANWAEARVIR